LDKTSFKIETRTIGGWSGYVTKNMKTGSVSVREHTAFLNMWLEKFIFCGKTVGPTNNTLKMAETLASGNLVPLGKHLLGSVYHLLHQVSTKLRAGQPISNLGGPWWFIQLWLNMYMHKIMGIKLSEMSFPSEGFNEGEETVVHQCTSFGEAAIMIANDSNVFGKTDFLRCFYNGFTEDSTIWFACHDDNKEYENSFKFHLDSWKDDEEATNIMREIISPRILPANFTSGKSAIGYEFCYPSVVAMQLGFVQLPPLLYFANKVQARNPIDTALTYNRLKSWEPVFDMTQLDDWQ